MGIRGKKLARLPAAGKTIAVALALLLAIVATVAIFMYVRGIEERAFEDAELVEVFVAQGPIEVGTSASEAGDAGLIARDTAPRGNVPVGAITDLGQIEGLVALERILTGEIVLRERWGSVEDAAVAFEIPEGFEAIAVEVGIPPGVAGYIRAGDRVSLIATVAAPGATVTDPDGTVTEEQGELRSQYLLQSIEVLAVGQRRAEVGEDAAPGGSVLMTVALEPEDAERLVFAIENASLYFTLLPEDAEPQETPGRTLDDLFN
jgi:pilus assembly protein CpaB